MGRTKALIPVGGVPMADLVAAALRAAGCAEVVAFGGDPVELAALDLPVLADRHPGAGPLGGVLGALEEFTSAGSDLRASRVAATHVVAVACDLPAITAADLVPVIEAARRDDVDVAVARTHRLEPACAVWRVSVAPRLRELFDGGERALHVAIGRLRSIPVDVAPSALANINTPDDLARYP